MASLEMANGPNRTNANSSRKPSLRSGHRRVLHQMDRSKAISYNNLVDCQKFFWQQIICCFEVPRELIVDNETQFDSKVFKEFCMQIGTKLCFTSVRHPQSNDLVERAKNIILQGISRRLHGKPKSKWAEELTSVIWSHNTFE